MVLMLLVVMERGDCLVDGVSSGDRRDRRSSTSSISGSSGGGGGGEGSGRGRGRGRPRRRSGRRRICRWVDLQLHAGLDQPDGVGEGGRGHASHRGR